MSGAEGMRPSSSVASRAGLARYRNLQEQEVQNSNKKSKTNLPNGWFYNENRQAEFWEDLEGFNESEEQTRELNQQEKIEDINAAANRVKDLLKQFDTQDQETLLELMQIVEGDENIGQYDKNSIMNDNWKKI